jgi:hypothetical protein
MQEALQQKEREAWILSADLNTANSATRESAGRVSELQQQLSAAEATIAELQFAAQMHKQRQGMLRLCRPTFLHLQDVC